MKLLGNLEDFLGTLENPKKKEMAKEVWLWSEKSLEEGKLQGWLKWSLDEMHRTLGTPEWKETKETIMYTGPDNYQMNKPRKEQDWIKRAWWNLVKYQYNDTYKKN